MFKGSIVALVTPFTEEGEIDFAVFDALIHWRGVILLLLSRRKRE